MLSILLICLGLVADDGAQPPAKAVPRPRRLRGRPQSRAGHDARAHVRLALWCEAHGMTAERMKHLAAAVAPRPRPTPWRAG